MGNFQRTSLLRGLLDEVELREGGKEHLKIAISHFDVCQENRNFVVHSLMVPEEETWLEHRKSTPHIQSRSLVGTDLLLAVLEDIKKNSEFWADLQDYLFSTTPMPIPLPPIPTQPVRLVNVLPIEIVKRAKPQFSGE